MRLSVSQLVLLIVGMAVVTYVVRLAPLIWLTRIPVPPWVRRWLEMVPVALFAAILVQTTVPQDGAWIWSTHLPLLAAIAAALTLGTVTRSMGWSVAAGFALYAGLRWVG